MNLDNIRCPGCNETRSDSWQFSVIRNGDLAGSFHTCPEPDCSTAFWYDPERNLAFTNMDEFAEMKNKARDDSNDEYSFKPPLSQDI